MTTKIYELQPLESQHQKSFYGKATVEVDENGNETLFSYGTRIIEKTADGNLIKYWDDWTVTTGKHIKAFCELCKKEYENLDNEENNKGYFYKCALVKEKENNYDAQLTSPERVYELAKTMGMENECEEYCYMIALNVNAKIIGIHEVSHGSLSSAPASPREVFKRAILNNASSIILMHNHPSGNSRPSPDDLHLTKRMIECGNLLGIKLNDHIVIGRGQYTSIATQDACLWNE